MSIATSILGPRGLAVVAGASLALFGSSAMAAITVTQITGTWTSVTPAGLSSLTGVGTSEIRWGGGVAAADKSGYRFTGVGTPLGVSLNNPFGLGTFTHINNPIDAGTSITAATLKVDFRLDIDGFDTGVLSSIFNFDHWETDNGANPCANGGANGSGVNVNGCADRVIFAINPGLSDSFMVAGTEYVLNISGFLIGGSPASEFWTTERLTNNAGLEGTIVARSSVVPIPAAAWLLGSGLLGLFGLARRKQQAAG